MILAMRSFAKTFSCVGKPGWCFHSNLFYGNGGAKFRKEEWQRIGDEIKPALSFARAYFVKVPRSGRGFGILSLYFNIDLFHSQIFRSSQPVRTITYFNSIFL